MVPTTRSLPPHHDCSGKNIKPPSYYDPGYYIAAQLEAAHGGDSKQQSSRSPRRLVMADDDNAVGRRRTQSQREEEAAGTSSRGGGGGNDEDGRDKDWLRLGLGAMASSSSTTSSSSAVGDTDGATAPAPPAALDLFGGGKQSASMMSRPPLFPLPIRSYHCQYGHDRHRPMTASGSMTPGPPFLPFARPLRSCSADLLMRVVSPPSPRMTESAGLWLTLQTAPNQVREPILPQIPKSYLRIRDCNMKVEVVLKYLADKLGFTQYHQVELTCRGHLLPPFLPMKHVRDSIWCGSPAPSQEDAELPHRRSPAAAAATTTDHVMALFYSTSRNH